MQRTIDIVLKRIQNVVNVEDKHLTLLEELATIQTEALAIKIGESEVPMTLNFIIVETTIARYRRVGAEGISDKRVDVITNKYQEDLFKPYEDVIADHIKSSGTNKKNFVRVI